MGERITRVFQTTALIEWGIHRPDECEHVVRDEYAGSIGFETIRSVVFKAPDDGHLWMIEYEWRAGSKSISETMRGKAEPATPEFEAVMVAPRIVTRTIYEPLCKGEDASKAFHMKGRILELGDLEEARGMVIELSKDDVTTLACAEMLYKAVEIVVRHQ